MSAYNCITTPIFKRSHCQFLYYFFFLLLILPTPIFAQHFFGRASFDCRRIHLRYCCSSRVQISCPEMCNLYACNTLPSLPHYKEGIRPELKIIQSSLLGTISNGGWLSEQLSPISISNEKKQTTISSQILQSTTPLGNVLTPFNSKLEIGLASQETLEESRSVISNKKNINVLTTVYTFNNRQTTVLPFPTLISWNKSGHDATDIDSKTVLTNNRFAIKIQKKNGALDGEIHVQEKENVNNQRPNKNGALRPPLAFTNDNKEVLEMINEVEHIKNTEFLSLNNFRPRQITASEEKEKSEVTYKPENIPPLPPHPEATWLPLKFSIKPSALSFSEVAQTTFAYKQIENTKRTLISNINGAVTVLPVSQHQSKNNTKNQLTNILNELDKKIENLSKPVRQSLYSTENVEQIFNLENKKPRHEVTFSSSFKRRGDLPIPTEETNKMRQIELSENKQWVVNGKSNNSAKVPIMSLNENNIGLFGNSHRLKTRKELNYWQRNATVLIPHSNSTLIPQSVTIVQEISKLCGKTPDFRPCVAMEIANKQMLSCCQQRLMPLGCLKLCNYNITQAEIKQAFDAGKCKISNVPTFLECASQSHDNLSCCKQRNIATKSGPQCEVFCNPAKGFGALGLQHLVCQNIIGDLLQCHHSGLRN